MCVDFRAFYEYFMACREFYGDFVVSLIDTRRLHRTNLSHVWSIFSANRNKKSKVLFIPRRNQSTNHNQCLDQTKDFLKWSNVKNTDKILTIECKHKTPLEIVTTTISQIPTHKFFRYNWFHLSTLNTSFLFFAAICFLTFSKQNMKKECELA